MLNTVFEILVWLEIAAIAAIVGLAFAPVSFWALCKREPPVWTQAGLQPRASVKKRQRRDDPLALESILAPLNTRTRRLPFGEMG